MDSMDDDAALRTYADALVGALDAAIGPWVVRCVRERLVAATGAADAEVLARAESAGARARVDVVDAVRALLAQDVDTQRSTPLTLVRGAVRYATDVLRAAGVPEVVRDEFSERAFPDDVYDLVPASFADVDERLREPALAWGAAKAHVHLRRRRAAGA